MSGFLGSIGQLIGGSSAKSDRKQTIQGYGDLNNVFNFGLPAAQSEFSAGSQAEGNAGAYYAKLLSGDRATALGAVAPEANQARASTDAGLKNLSTTGTARGGGTNTTALQAKSGTDATIDNLLFGARSGAAKGEASLGGQQVGEGLGFGGLAANAAQDLTKDSIDSRSQSYLIHQATANNVTNAINDALAFLGIPT